MLISSSSLQVTLTTTGYGDMYPITNWGKFVAGITMLCCMVTVALPISVVGGNFSTMWTEYKQIKDAADRSKKVRIRWVKIVRLVSPGSVLLYVCLWKRGVLNRAARTSISTYLYLTCLRLLSLPAIPTALQISCP